MNTDPIEAVLAEKMRREKAQAWEYGFQAGQIYGAQRERFDPDRSHPLDEPTPPSNPYGDPR
jgi:hypothetical protein